MQLAGTLASLVSIEQRELRTATLMLAHSFAMGLTTVFFETAASALFLSHFESSALPWVYLAAAATSAVTGIVYTSLLGRVAFRRLMLGTLGFLALTTVALRVGLWLTPAGGLLFAVLVWYRVISILTDLEYWAVAARMYDVRQAKRLYPFIGSGEVVARIAGAFSVPIFLGYMGVENLLLLSAAAAAACMGLLGLALRGRNVDSAPGSKSKQENKWGLLEPLRAVTKTPYLRLLVSIAFFAVLGKYFVDFAFLAEMRGRFTGVKELASAFAIFSGVSQSLSLLTRVFVAGRVLNRYGVKAGLLVLPIAHLACTVLLVISGVTPGLALLVFWFAIGNQGLYKTLKHPIDNPSFKLLYQPLAKDERLKTQVAVETIVTPIGIAIAGAVMLQFSVLIPYDPVTFALALAMAFAGWVFFARQAGRAYAGALVEALRGRVEDIDYSFDDERNLPVLKETLASGRPPEVLFALDLLEKSSHRADQLEPLLIGLLDHASPDVRISALLRIEQHAMRSAAPSILERLDTEQSPAVTGALLRALGGTIGGGEYEARVSRHLTHADPQIRMGAIIGLLRNGKAGRHLETLAASPNIAERAFAARAIGETRLPHLAPMLQPLLDDESTEVRRAALLAAGRLGASAPWKRVIECLDDRALTGSATSALVTGGAAPLSHLTESFHPGVSPRRLQRIARVLGRRSDAAAAEILFFRIDFPNEIVRHEVLDSLSACAFQAQPNRRATIDECLEREAQDAAAKLAALHAVADTDLQLLRSALESELIRSQDRLTLLLEYIYDREAMELVKENRTHESREKRAYALEVLDVTIETEHKKMLMPLLEGRLSPPLRGDAGRASMDRMPYILLVAFAALFGASASPAEDSLYAQALVRVADGDSVPIPRVDPPTPASEDAEDEECAEDDDDCDDDEKETKVYWKDGETHFDMEGAHITLANRIQVRYSHLFPDDDLRLPGTTERGQSKGSFRIRRAKTTFEGWFWKPELTFELQLNWPSRSPGPAPTARWRTATSTGTPRRGAPSWFGSASSRCRSVVKR